MNKIISIATLCLFSTNSTTAQTSKTAIQYYNDGFALQDASKFTEALAAFKNAIVKNPNYKEALYNAGWTNNELKKYAEAIPFLKKAKSLWPNEPKVYLELGYAYEKTNNKTDAVDSYNTCLSIKKDYALAYKYLGILYYDEANYEKALENLDLYITYRPDTDDDDIYYRKAVSENELGQYNDALASITKANTLKPDNVKFLNELGYTYLFLENADDALTYYNKALALDARSLTAANGRADVYRKLKKDPAEAIKLYAKALDIDTKNIKANYWTGWCYNDLGKYYDAIPFLKKVIAVDDKYVSAYTELGYCNYALKKYDEALDDFKKAFAIEKTALSLYYTGLCFVGKNEKTSVLKLIIDLKSMKSDFADKLQKLADKM